MVQRTISADRLVGMLGSAAHTAPAYQGIADAIRLLIADGRLPHGTRLPSERELTDRLGVSRTTVSRAYATLRDRGYLESRRGSGSVTRLPGGRTPDAAASLLSPGEQAPGYVDLTCAAPAAPPGTAHAFETALEQLPSHLAGSGYQPAGIPTLRQAIADDYAARGLPTDPEQIVVTTGALAALAVAARTLLGIGDRVLMESPTYPNAIAAMRRSGGRLVGVPVQPDGWDVAGVEATLRQTAPLLAVLIPDFHNPTGGLMEEPDRQAVGDALNRSRTRLLVDESLVHLGLDRTDLPRPMAAFARRALVIGSASKCFWGGLRIGWLRAPHDDVGVLTESRLSLDLGAPVLEQLVLAEMLRRREEFLQHRREEVRRSRAALLDALARHLPDWEYVVPPGGLALWCRLPQPLSSALAAAAERQQVLLAPGPRFAVDPGLERYVRVPYTLPAEVLDDAVARIATAWADAERQRAATGRRTPLVA